MKERTCICLIRMYMSIYVVYQADVERVDDKNGISMKLSKHAIISKL